MIGTPHPNLYPDSWARPLGLGPRFTDSEAGVQVPIYDAIWARGGKSPIYVLSIIDYLMMVKYS